MKNVSFGGVISMKIKKLFGPPIAYSCSPSKKTDILCYRRCREVVARDRSGLVNIGRNEKMPFNRPGGHVDRCISL